MATGTPVVVSRIQNRRGLQADFDNFPTSLTFSTSTIIWAPI